MAPGDKAACRECGLQNCSYSYKPHGPTFQLCSQRAKNPTTMRTARVRRTPEAHSPGASSIFHIALVDKHWGSVKDGTTHLIKEGMP